MQDKLCIDIFVSTYNNTRAATSHIVLQYKILKFLNKRNSLMEKFMNLKYYETLSINLHHPQIYWQHLQSLSQQYHSVKRWWITVNYF